MSSDTFFVGAMPVARPGAIGNNVEYCFENRATHRVAPTGPVSASISAIMRHPK
jgi:hypothetical protein